LILDALPRPPAEGIAGHATLDDLFRRAAALGPDALALCDPPNRESFTDGPARSLTYAQADRMISAFAARLRRMNLGADAIVALQMGNTIDQVLALLAVLRAGLIAMPLPSLWRRAAVTEALHRAGATALIVNGRVGATDHFDLAVNAAAEVFSVRYVCGFGSSPPDGVIALDDLYAASPAVAFERPPTRDPGAHLAVVTWDITPAGMVPVARSHAEVIAGGLAVLLESRIREGAAILSTIQAGSFAALAVALVPWLMVSGTLVLHHPFDAETFKAQVRNHDCDAIVVPAALIPRLLEARLLPPGHLKCVVSVWRAPEQAARAPEWRDQFRALIDVQVFGEIGLVAARRGPGGRPASIPIGILTAPRGAGGGMIVNDVAVTARRTVALRGPMVPRTPFPPGIEKTQEPYLRIDDEGFVDTSYACAVGPFGSALMVSTSPAGLVSCGGYRFAVGEINALIAGLDPSGTLAVLPDTLTGQRLAGAAKDADRLRRKLNEIGANPLLVDAFRDRRRVG
jgi:hypothetical protein